MKDNMKYETPEVPALPLLALKPTKMRALLCAPAVSGIAVLLLALAPVAHANATPARACPNGGLFAGNVSMTVLAPKPHEVIYGPDLALKVVAHGYSLDDYYAGSPALACIGHYHEYIDGQAGNFFQGLIDMTPLQDPTRDTISMMGLSDGPHVLTLVPAENDHTVIWSKAVSIPFDYEGQYQPEPPGYDGTGTPSITITSPAPGTTVTGKSFTMTVSVHNYVICGGCFGKGQVAGEGHWHVFEDNVAMAGMRQMANTNSVTVPLPNYAPGWHTFYAVLTYNNHMPLMVTIQGKPQMVMDSVRLYVNR